MSTMLAATYAYQVEAFGACWPELAPLFAAHHAERRLTLPLLPLDVDTVGYAALEAAGVLVLLTLRVDGVLQGYTLSVLVPHLHAAAHRCAFVDAYYVTPACRDGGTAQALFAATEQVWRARGVVRAYVSVPDARLGRWMRQQRWAQDAVLYRKDLLCPKL